ncbi:hypothetical protein [Nodularia sp. UHCC 0506]|uniref:hypothetical protein n=1 Tax=Nodularia sp. UHCC 0506 TaxID=3110243 RepID=UPI002B21F955|nr:hypothetical protein [Nodularia sp. UHCC 0506]MEA5514275.1 hypothetical protein [Nodularia sp. UHCC 0506]
MLCDVIKIPPFGLWCPMHGLRLSKLTHVCSNCGYTTDRNVDAPQVVLSQELAAVGHTVKMLAEGKFMGIPVKQESPNYKFEECQ